MKARAPLIVSVAILLFLLGSTACRRLGHGQRWSPEEVATLRSLWIESLAELPADPSNAYDDDERAARLGHRLFFDTRFSRNGAISCATCHRPESQFQEGTQLGHGVGTTSRSTMTLVGSAYSPWLFWDGRKDSLWAQALEPLESAVEHGGDRTLYAHLIARHYRDEYEAIFGPLPDLSHLPQRAGPVGEPVARMAWEGMSSADRESVTRIYANMGKAIAAYERLLRPSPAPFDAYVQAVVTGDDERAASILSEEEIAGLRLFIGKANCIQCHSGPLFTDNDFHNTGVPAIAALPPDHGRAAGARKVAVDEFNCLSVYSDAPPEACAQLRSLVLDEQRQERQFRPPSLRNVDGRSPFMHAGQFWTLEEVLAHYNSAPAAPAGQSELEPLNLSDQEMAQLIAFLKTLSGPLDIDERWLSAP